MRPLSWLLRLGLVVGAGALLVTALVVAVAPRVWEAANAHEELPVDLPEFAPLARRSYVYDRNGGLLAIYELENSQPISLQDVPPRVIEAFLAVEDEEFYIHDGINVRSLIRATLSNFASEAPQQGASTITMQVVKNEYLAGLDRDARYKALQIHYARMLEKEKTKDEILERYLNTVFFGNNAYGIQAASETYFGKTAKDLTFIEAAFLAGLVRSPSGYDPINEPERSRARFVQVLARLVDDGMVKQRAADRLEREFVLPEQVRTLESQQTRRTYYTEALRDYLLNRSDVLGKTYEERYSAMYRGGLRIHTTFDPALQLHAEAAHDVLPENSLGVDSAILSLDTQTGAIRAMVGGDGFEAGQNEVNMALSPRQTGSSIKYFILAAALQAGAEAEDMIVGEAQCTIPNPDDPLDPFIITDAVGANPQLDTLNRMTYDSINCAYARLSQIVGLHRMVDTVYRMAASAYLSPETDADDPLRNEPLQPYASFATGANEMSPLDMAAGAQSIANDGVHHEPYYVERVENGERKEIYKHFSAGTQVLDRGVALRTLGVLKNVLGSDGTGRHYPLDGRPAAGKTGTQADNTNAWFVGFTPQLTTAVWVGNPTAYVKMVDIPEWSEFGVERVQGGLIPAMVWKAYMDPAHAGLPVQDWAAPPQPRREPVRLFLPGMECAKRVVGYDHIVLGFANAASTGTEDPRSGFAPTQPTEQPAPIDPPPDEPRVTGPSPDSKPPGGDGPTTSRPGRPRPTRPTSPPPPQTAYVPIYENVTATTIPPDEVDPNAPLPSVPLTESVSAC